MMVIKDDPNERVIWLDFDQAQTFYPDRLTEEQKEWIDFENRLVQLWSKMGVDYRQIKPLSPLLRATVC